MLSVEQSAELIKCGVSEERASKMWVDSPEGGYNCEKNNLLLEALVWKKENDCKPVDFAPIFTLTDLLSLLPKEIDNGLYSLDLMADNVEWYSVYSSAHEGYDLYLVANEKELIDVLYKTLLWAIDHNHVKLDLG